MEIVKRIKAIILLQSEEWFKELIEGISNLEISNDYILDLKVETDLESFIAYSQLNPVDCFFIDLSYTRISAIELADKLRKSQKYKKTPLIFLADKKNKNQECNPMHYSALNIDMVISWPMAFAEIKAPLIGVLMKKFGSVIPKNFNVLILDDNFEIIYIMKAYMDELQHSKFDTCTSLSEARQLVSKNDYDLLLLDWNLPDGTCIDLIEYMREKKDRTRLNKALIMAVTGRDNVEDIMTLLKYNVKDYIIKPFEYDEFEEKLVYALEKHKKSAAG